MPGRSEDSLTRVRLILRLGRSPTEEAAWAEFVARYGSKVFAWGRGWGLQQADAEDVTQAVLIKLARLMSRFTYDAQGSFRGRLRTPARNAWRDWAAQRGQQATGGQAEASSALASVEARDDLVGRPEETFDMEVLAEAVHRVGEQVSPRTWEAYVLTAHQGLLAAEVADRLGMSVANVFKAKSNVLKRIRAEVQALEAGPDDDGTPAHGGETAVRDRAR